MNRFYPFGVLIFLGMIAFAVGINGPYFGVFLNIPSLIMVLGLPAALLFATHSPREMRAAFRAAYRSEDAAELRASISFFVAMQRYLLWSGFLATMLGVIVLLAVLGDETMIGAGAALALITVLYSLILNLGIALPFRHACEKRLARAN